MRLGIFGGTFDPPHTGHLILASEARHQLSLDRVLFTLTPDPPHKQERKITVLDHRIDMLEAAIAGNEDFEFSRIELERAGPHYAVDTLLILKEQFPVAVFVYLMGADSLIELPSWHQPRKFVDHVHAIGVMRRPGEPIDIMELEARLPGLTKKVHYVKVPLLDIASRDIRQRIVDGKPFQYFLPKGVYRIIDQRGLYRNST